MGVLIAIGVAIMIAGVCIKPRDESVAWGPLWGLSENSTPLGKLVFVAGACMLIYGVRGLLL